jgi:hypothetical protein
MIIETDNLSESEESQIETRRIIRNNQNDQQDHHDSRNDQK